MPPPPKSVDTAATTIAMDTPGQADQNQLTEPTEEFFMKATMALDAESIEEKVAEMGAEDKSAPRPKTIMIKRPGGTTSATAKTVKTLRPSPESNAPTAGGVKTIKLSRPDGASEGIPSEKKSSTSRVELPEDLMAPAESGSRKRTVKIKRPGGGSITAPSVATDRAAMAGGTIHAAGRTFDLQSTGTDGTIHVTWTVLSILSFVVSAAALYVILATILPNLVVPGMERLVSW